jgi:hypothetical protein
MATTGHGWDRGLLSSSATHTFSINNIKVVSDDNFLTWYAFPQVWWHTHQTPPVRRLRKDYLEFNVNQNCITRPCHNRIHIAIKCKLETKLTPNFQQ